MLSFSLGPFVLSVAHALLGVALIVALITGKIAARRRDVPIIDTLFNMVLIGVVAARIVFVARYASEYRQDMLGIIDIRDGGFDTIGGLIGMAGYAVFTAVRRPAIRRPLASAVFAGALTWGLTGGVLMLIEHETKRMPDAPLITLDGSRTQLATIQADAGNVPVVVNLWASWCPPCRAEMPVLEAAQKRHDNVLFVFANQAEATPTIQRFLDSQDLELDHVVRDAGGRLAQRVGSAALPTTLFFNRDGQLVDSHLGQLSRASLAAALERFDTTSTSATP